MRLVYVLYGLFLLSFGSLSFGNADPNFVPRPPKQMGNLTVLSCRNIEGGNVQILAVDPNGKPFSVKVSDFRCEDIPGWSEWKEDVKETRKRDPFKTIR
ncbi:MAG: hypothetical protein Q7R58_01185 [bacterium]|nr:hypothetical protein [bacterium]